MSAKTSIAWCDSKQCSACRRELPASAFFKDRSRPNGLAYVCRDCKNAHARNTYKPKPRQRRGWLVATRDGDKKQARRRVNYLVEQGLIPRPEELGCMDCGDGVFPGEPRHEYDHARGYDGKNQLYVEPVCAICHRNREEARRSG